MVLVKGRALRTVLALYQAGAGLGGLWVLLLSGQFRIHGPLPIRILLVALFTAYCVLLTSAGFLLGRAHALGVPLSVIAQGFQIPQLSSHAFHLRNCDACKPGAVGDVTPRYRCTRRCACPDSPPIGPFASSRALKGGTTHLLAVRRRVSGRASTSLSTARRSAAGSASTLFSRLRRRAVFGDVPSFIGFTPSSSSVVTRSAWAGLALSQRQLCARATTRIACPSPVDGDSAAQQCRWYVARKPG